MLPPDPVDLALAMSGDLDADILRGYIEDRTGVLTALTAPPPPAAAPLLPRQHAHGVSSPAISVYSLMRGLRRERSQARHTGEGATSTSGT